MENQRQESFKQLRQPCVELSSIGLRFRGNQATSQELMRALEPVHDVLQTLAGKNALDEKLAEYAFFPLTHIFNQTQRLPTRCLEIAVHSLQILVISGYRSQLNPALGKQLIILLTLVVAGSPNKAEDKSLPKAQASEELAVAGFDCMRSVFDVLEGPVAGKTIFHEIGTATVVDQTVYMLLEGLADERSDEVCLAAAKALQALYARITDRVVLASIMPRTVSALAKVVRPTTQARRSYKLLQISLQILTYILRTVLNDRVANMEKPPPSLGQSDGLVLDDSWLKATTTQIKLALANVIQIRRHPRLEVQTAMLDLCVMVVEDCPNTLKDAVQMMVETAVVLADKEEEGSNHAYNIVSHLTTSYPIVLESLKESLHTWLTSFPRIMQSNDETAKQWGIRQISTAFQILSQVQSQSDLLTAGLATGLCDSVGAVVKQGTTALQPVSSSTFGDVKWEVLHLDADSKTFPPVLLDHRSQQQTLKDLRSMIIRLNFSESGNEITRSIINRLHSASDSSIIAPFWLALTSLRAQAQQSAAFDDLISEDLLKQPLAGPNRWSMIEELYYVSLSILNDIPSDGSGDWRTAALALEAVALQAQQLGEAFRPELMDTLYPTLQLLASSNPNLQKHAMTCLNILTSACNYQDAGSMVIENVDYLVNSVGLKLNTFDVSPYPPQVLFMMVKLCGARLIPYLDDLVDSVFGILDLYHGYPKLVEIMFKTLAAVVEEGSKKPYLLTIDSGRESGPFDSHKTKYQHLSVAALAGNISSRKEKLSNIAIEDMEADGNVYHPKKPWSETYENQPPESESIEELLNKAKSDEPLPPPKEPEDSEKPLSKTHSLLLHIVKSIPLHLSSPSPYLRRSLLSILIDVLPTLSQNENSFLPLINDLWPSVASRVIFPSSLGAELSSKTLMTRSTTESNRSANQPDTHAYQEETFVITTACQAMEVMCKGAGDFMASRIETEFPRWARLYQRVWTRVRKDAESVNERRARQQKGKANASFTEAFEPSLAVVSSLALSTTTHGSKAFTPEHALWRALISLFLTVLSHVRLPLEVGDQICEMLGSWVALFVGTDYYFLPSRRTAIAENEAQRSVRESVEDAIQAMETWNSDLTWFIFVHQIRSAPVTTGISTPVHAVDESKLLVNFDGEKLHFAEVVF
ncbi:Armadillo-like helical [Penicillium argentinense]|uniref:Armadillo-like helical n=1 Tax=Penicillium argentinense TaxID=1131581 RepID=A0A9W9KFF1_9EURO|nr:Armadillo-like helical [Penicillium argentinense]KAJ5103142.1 Armadillo-like helical [Penicillium argentinense]